MTQNYLTPIDKTYSYLGKPPYTMEDGVKEIIEWYHKESKQAVQLSEKKLRVDINIQKRLVTA